MRLLPELEQAQEYAKSKATAQHASLTVMDRKVRVKPRGLSRCAGTLFFDYHLQWDGIDVLVMSDVPGDRGEIAHIKFSSFRLMRDGHKKCWRDARELLRDLGIKTQTNLVARIDLCIDLPGVSVKEFCEAYQRRDFIGRARSGGVFDDELGYTGFVRGKGSAMMRIYDKLLEATKKADPAKFEVLKQRRWGGVLPEAATRVEYQLRREWLAQWHTVAPDGFQGEARTVEQVFDLLPTITQYLVEHWFRIVDDAERHREHGNHARAEASELWAKVCEAFAAWAEGEVVALVRKATGTPDDEKLLRQIGGLVASVGSAMPEKFKRARQVLQRVMDRVDAVCGDGLLEKLEQRRDDLDASGRARFLGVPVRPLTKAPHLNYPQQERLELDYAALPY
ncbi:hypothetical protein [Botrimarina colliarenosi]|nr:hypothetical protein [Botrimarina colliarenosi]